MNPEPEGLLSILIVFISVISSGAEKDGNKKPGYSEQSSE